MKFDENDMVILDSLTDEELRAFVCFLEFEIQRHHDAIIDAEAKIYLCSKGVGKELWEAAIRRHQKDILSAQERINLAYGGKNDNLCYYWG